MVGTVKAKAPRVARKGETLLCLPGPSQAGAVQLWALGPAGPPECLQSAESLADLRPPASARLVLPMADVYCLPLWINETDPRQFREVISLQLELQGHRRSEGTEQAFEWDVIATEGARTLLMVGLLADPLPDDYLLSTAGRFDVSPRCRNFAADALTVWREQDRIGFVITRGEQPVYFQALKTGTLSTGAGQDIACALATLQMQEVIGNLRQTVSWMPLGEVEKKVLAEATRLTVQEVQTPPPRLPARSWSLVPAEIIARQRATRSRQSWSRGLLIALAVYLVAVAAFAGRTLYLAHEEASLNAWQKDHGTEIDLVEKTSAAWRDLAPALDPNSYPLEELLACTRSLPADQLHLTLFEARPGHLLIKGEATNAAAAFQFLDQLKKNTHFAGYTWDMAPPHLLPNDLAQLQIEGTHASAD
jgi:hypothetical protein